MPMRGPQRRPSSGRGANNIDAIDRVVDESEVKEHSQESNTLARVTDVPEQPILGDAINKPRKRRLPVICMRSSGDEQLETDKLSTRSQKKYTIWSQIRYTIFNSWINVIIIAAPVGIALSFTSVNPIVIFIVNFLAIIPLAGMLSYATEEISLRTGETIGGLLNASFGYVSVHCPSAHTHVPFPGTRLSSSSLSLPSFRTRL